jgi:anti-sigma factor RsiW
MTSPAELLPNGHVGDLKLPYCEGLLTEAEHRAVADHLAVCPACAAELEEFRQWIGRLEALKEVACPADWELFEYARGNLPSERVQAHIECCPACAASIPRFSSGAPDEALPDGLWHAMQARLTDETAPPVRNAAAREPAPTGLWRRIAEFFRTPPLMAGAVAVAALLAVIVILRTEFRTGFFDHPAPGRQAGSQSAGEQQPDDSSGIGPEDQGIPSAPNGSPVPSPPTGPQPPSPMAQGPPESSPAQPPEQAAPPEPRFSIAKSRVAWKKDYHPVKLMGEPEGRPRGGDSERPRLATLLIIDAPETRGFSQEAVDRLYEAMDPPWRLEKTFDPLNPATIAEALRKEAKSLSTQEDVLPFLRDHLHAANALVVALSRDAGTYTVTARFADTVSGRTLKETATHDIPRDELPAAIKATVATLAKEVYEHMQNH